MFKTIYRSVTSTFKKLISRSRKEYRFTVLMIDNSVGTVQAKSLSAGDIIVLEVHDGTGESIIRLGEVREVMRREKA